MANCFRRCEQDRGVIRRRVWPLALLSVISCILPSVAALAQPFPSKSVHIVVPYTGGGSLDVFARAIANGLTTLWKQPVVVENVSGGGSIIGTERIANAPPDGHTLLMTIDASVVANRFLYRKLPYDPDKSLSPITMIARTGQFVIVNPSVPANTIRELVEVARRAPGKIAYSSTGIGSPPHLAFETIAKREGVQFLHAIYRGTATYVPAVVSGEVQASGAAGSVAGGMVKAGKLKVLAIGGARRSNLFPDVPTLAELGYPVTALTIWFGLFAPGGASAELVERIYRDATGIAKRPEFSEKYITPYDIDLVVSTPAEFASAIRADVAIVAEMVKAAGIKPE